MIKVAITGNIASGKSKVEEYITTLGYKVIDSDKINHEILSTDIFAIEEIKSAFLNYDILDEDGNLSREKIGKIVFNNIDLKKKLEEILHKRISIKIQEFYLKNSQEKVLFVSVPLLFEANMQNQFDKIIFISAPEEKRIQRLINRNGYDIEYAKKRVASQISEDIKIPQVDYVIDNNSDLENLYFQVDEIVNKITCL